MKPESDHLRQQHRHRLTKHGRLRFNPAHAPAQNSQTINHGGVAVGTDQSIRIGQCPAFSLFVHKYNAGKVFQIDLVNNPGFWRHHAEVFESVLAPSQEDVAFFVSLIFQVRVGHERNARSSRIDLNRVIDHKFNRLKRIDLSGIATHGRHGIAHRSQIDDRWNTCKVLQENPGRCEADFVGWLGRGVPVRNGIHSLSRYGNAIFST